MDNKKETRKANNIKKNLLIWLVSWFVVWICTISWEGVSELVKSNRWVSEITVTYIKILLPCLLFFMFFLYVLRK